MRTERPGARPGVGRWLICSDASKASGPAAGGTEKLQVFIKNHAVINLRRALRVSQRTNTVVPYATSGDTPASHPCSLLV